MDSTATETGDHYRLILRLLKDRGLADAGTSVLVVCGGDLDRDALLAEGFANVVISNLDSRMREDQFAPYGWSYQDAEELTYPDEHFDICVVHAGLHHCYVPQRAIAEMYRVARKAVVAFEPLDGMFTRLGLRLGFGQLYETAAVYGNDLTFGGVRNSSIPNFVYRFTKNEIVKCVSTLAPHARPTIFFRYHLEFPWQQLRWRTDRLKYSLIKASEVVLRLGHAAIPALVSNGIVAVIRKPEIPADLQPWLDAENGTISAKPQWFAEQYAAGNKQLSLEERS